MAAEFNHVHKEAQSAATAKRKGEHIRICLEEQVVAEGIATGLDNVRFRHRALPELAFDSISLESEFLGKKIGTPLMVSSMTGGTAEAGEINRRLAEAAQQHGWAIGLGSMRAAIENERLASTFQIRSYAPDVPIIANLGAVQLNYGYGIDQCRKAVDLAEADGLVLHLNSMQEVFQAEGDTNFSNLLGKIEQICRSLDVPVGIKEVGWGIDGDTAQSLMSVGVAFIDVAGAGGTSWSQVEKYRSSDTMKRLAAETFADWGISTADCIADIRAKAPTARIIGSGGLLHGVHAAKAIALGADLVGFGRALLPRAAVTEEGEIWEEALHDQFRRIAFELKAAMFGIGAGSIEELQHTTRLVK
ncbi:type 2 isopentenyl-diphosphate Delta-isomerase [Paenibacillus sp. GCM10012307]|uniref:Isopentenyl-diphosphate delta-isomerase n=1 Tax=Paenibacillus roseus TaxID=2798579 RepID=A0A934MVE1_9BACL|nr:type 2 isopentenyl-diphosphate Delta-isomerase [Paenibacillus roseus]MBJ6362022.1 type 2 isopentenyl-diphosphate Delta-isomerase [Paenibacillus roseus]